MSSQEDSTVSDTLAVVKVLRKHMKEPHCKHDINAIMKEALGRKDGVRLVAETPTPTDIVITPVTNRNDYTDTIQS